MNAGAVNTNRTTIPIAAQNNISGIDDVLDREAFLQLLVTQLRYQNPMNPLTNEQFIAQSAEFSSLEQIRTLNANVEALIDFQKVSGRTAALNLIGKHVVAQHSQISLHGVSPVSLNYSLSADAAKVAITIYNTYGDAVTTINVGSRPAGNSNFVWNGLNASGIRIPDGDYIYKVSAVDARGNSINATETISGIVNGLKFEGEQPQISINGLYVPLQDILEVVS